MRHQLFLIIGLIVCSCAISKKQDSNKIKNDAFKFLSASVLKRADWALKQKPITITASVAVRSAGGTHDFYSEGDYWWPNPDKPDGPYIQRDGLSNPNNFSEHRLAMIRFASIIGALSSAYKLTGNEKYVQHAILHLKAWFIAPTTKMNPSLDFAQAIMGVTKGRGIGIIDTIHLIEVAQGALVMKNSPLMSAEVFHKIQSWFASYNKWLTTSKNGLDEKNAKNNHGTCWVLQVASFAKLCGDEELMEECRNRYKQVLLPTQMNENGAFPLELSRTKPFGYSIFNLDAMAGICQILSTPEDILWDYETPEGKSINRGIEFLYPYIINKSKWPYQKDVLYWENWPVAQPFLLLAANSYENQAYLDTWKTLNHYPTEAEVIRNLPLRHPIIWL